MEKFEVKTNFGVITRITSSSFNFNSNTFIPTNSNLFSFFEVLCCLTSLKRISGFVSTSSLNAKDKVSLLEPARIVNSSFSFSASLQTSFPISEVKLFFKKTSFCSLIVSTQKTDDLSIEFLIIQFLFVSLESKL